MSDKVNRVSDAESAVMKVLWGNKAPMTERQILVALGEERDWSPTTIKTLLKRLLDKGAVQREKKEVFHYVPVLSQAEFAKERTVDLVNRVFDGSAKSLVSAMLNNDILSDDDMDDLKTYWQERKKKNE